MIILSYASIKFVHLISYGSNTIMLSTQDSYFDSDFKIKEDDMMIAFGLTAYDND